MEFDPSRHTRSWSSFVDALAGADDLITGRADPESHLELAAGYRYLTRLLSAGATLCVEAADPDYPAFVRLVEPHTAWGIDNPDCLYLYAPVAGTRVYRIAGKLGGARLLDIQVMRGHFADAPDFGVISTANQHDLGLEPGTDFEIELIPRVDDARADTPLWLEPDAGFVLVRQYFADWDAETPAALEIEAADVVYPPPVTPARTEPRFDRYRRWMTSAARHWADLAAGFMQVGVNEMVFIDPGASAAGGGFAGLRYGFGNFTCGPDEAVVLEVDPPACRYWSFALADRWWQSLDYLNRQVSLNDAQAHLDADGKLRIVISHADPGAPNWLDASGFMEGSIAGRYLLADESPAPRLERIPVGDVEAYLPPGTPLLSPAQRSATIASRRRALLRRLGRGRGR